MLRKEKTKLLLQRKRYYRKRPNLRKLFCHFLKREKKREFLTVIYPGGLSKLEKWADRNLTKLNKEKCKDWHNGEQQPQAPVHAGGHPAGKQRVRNRPGCPGGHQVDHEKAMCLCRKES